MDKTKIEMEKIKKFVTLVLALTIELQYHVYFKVIGIRPLAPVQNSVSLRLVQREILNFVINLPDVETTTKWLDSILTKVSIIKRFCTLEFILDVQSQFCSILSIVKLREN